jgi:hypothetical protein
MSAMHWSQAKTVLEESRQSVSTSSKTYFYQGGVYRSDKEVLQTLDG